MPTFQLNTSVFIGVKVISLHFTVMRRLKQSVEMSARFSNLKIGIRELSFPPIISFIMLANAEHGTTTRTVHLVPGLHVNVKCKVCSLEQDHHEHNCTMKQKKKCIDYYFLSRTLAYYSIIMLIMAIKA